MFKQLIEKNIGFSLEDYGDNHYNTFWDIKIVLENKDLFLYELNASKLDDIVNLNDYFDYLCLRKLALFQEMITKINNDEEKKFNAGYIQNSK